MEGWTSLAQCQHELFGRDLGLTQETSEGADLDFAVHWHDAAPGVAFQNDVTSALTNLLKSKTFQVLAGSRSRRRAAA